MLLSLGIVSTNLNSLLLQTDLVCVIFITAKLYRSNAFCIVARPRKTAISACRLRSPPAASWGPEMIRKLVKYHNTGSFFYIQLLFTKTDNVWRCKRNAILTRVNMHTIFWDNTKEVCHPRRSRMWCMFWVWFSYMHNPYVFFVF